MTTAAAVMDALEGALDFAIIRASSLASSTKTLLATLRGSQTGDSSHEDVEQCEVWGHAAIDWRPADPEGDDACEAVIWRRGDEFVALATKDRRYQVTVDAGEVAIHAQGDSAAVIRLKPGGEVIIESGDIKLGSGSASDYVALASLVRDELDKIEATLATGQTPVGSGGGGGAVTFTTPYTASDVAAGSVTAE